MRLIYLECSAGIAGDMLLASLLDLGASLETILDGLRSLRLSEPWELEVIETARQGVRAKQVIVRVHGAQADQAPEWPVHHHHGHPDHHGHHHHHGHGDHDHPHPGGEHDHDHGRQRHDRDDGEASPACHAPARPYRAIRELLASAPLPERVRQIAQRVFWELAQAEAAVHGMDPEDVHFHEVGSTDAIIDVVGCALALESLGIEALEASPLHLGSGFVSMAHGRMPVPAPATLRLVQGLEAYQTTVRGELVTPTGAALVRALCRRVGPMPRMRIERTGWGAGAKEFEIPNVLRAVLGEPVDESGGLHRDEVVELETNLDDITPELLGALIERTMEQGALDAWVTPATMKKGRPGHVFHVLASADRLEPMAGLILRESTALGVRYRSLNRLTLEREWITVTTSAGDVRVKVGRRDGEVYNVAPEFDDCARAARRAGVPLKLVMAEASKLALIQLEAPHAP